MAKGIANGKFDQLVQDVGKLMSNGFEFDEVVDLLNVSPETAEKAMKNLTSKSDA